jgi:hypothetical protein
MKCIESSVFWDISMSSPLKVSRRFGGTRRLRLQGRRMNQEKKQRAVGGVISTEVERVLPTTEKKPQVLHEIYRFSRLCKYGLLSYDTVVTNVSDDHTAHICNVKWLFQKLTCML